MVKLSKDFREKLTWLGGAAWAEAEKSRASRSGDLLASGTRTFIAPSNWDGIAKSSKFFYSKFVPIGKSVSERSGVGQADQGICLLAELAQAPRRAIGTLAFHERNFLLQKFKNPSRGLGFCRIFGAGKGARTLDLHLGKVAL